MGSATPGIPGVSVLTRRVLLLACLAGTAGTSSGCGSSFDPGQVSDGRLSSLYHSPTGTATPGVISLVNGPGRAALLYVPTGYAPATPVPLLLLFHGAGGTAQPMIDGFKSLADEFGLALLAVDSWAATWDIAQGSFGPDVAFIDQMINLVFDRVAIRQNRVAAAGFSDGASYALSLGITNGDLFTRLIAFSPGFVAAGVPHGKPPIFVSHGIRDAILPIDQASRRIVPALRQAGYDVEYQEFDGPHAIPTDISRQAIQWLIADRPPAG